MIGKLIRIKTGKETEPMETGKMINKISVRLRRRSNIVQEAIGITGGQGKILHYILVDGREHSVYQRDIEEEFGFRPATVTEYLKALEQKGLISRIPDEKDARWKKIVFTPKADTIRQALEQEIEETESLLLRGITGEEKEMFLAVAGKMLRNLE